MLLILSKICSYIMAIQLLSFLFFKFNSWLSFFNLPDPSWITLFLIIPLLMFFTSSLPDEEDTREYSDEELEEIRELEEDLYCAYTYSGKSYSNICQKIERKGYSKAIFKNNNDSSIIPFILALILGSICTFYYIKWLLENI